ncbi:MAG: DUF4172 domain-containing protein [Bacteroidota bacterium]
MYNWELKNWPNFIYNESDYESDLTNYLAKTSIVSTLLEGIPENLKPDLVIQSMLVQALKTSEIEGELLSREDVFSSIRKNLGFPSPKKNVKDQRALGISELVAENYRTFNRSLSKKMLFNWHAILMKGNSKINKGKWRFHCEPMQVVSGTIGKEKVHFEAPPSKQVPDEMNRYIQWFNYTAPKSKGCIDNIVVRSAIAHVYFESIHPFEDGNGRIGRFSSEKALLLNSTLPEALIARGLYYMQTSRYEEAREYFEKVLEYNPNSAWTHNFLSEIYHLYLPNIEKYLIHTLSALRLDLTKSDSGDVSITHLILANALSQSGIMDKAKKHVRISLEYDPKNTFSRYLEVFIDLVNGTDMNEAIGRMKGVYNDDTTRLDVIKELATLYYGKQDYEKAYEYFDKFIKLKELYGLNLFPDTDITIAYVLRAVGNTTRASTYRIFVDENTTTVYKPLLETLSLLYDGKKKKALDSFEEFSKADDYVYWLLLLRDDPIFKAVKDDPRFLSIYNSMKSNFEVRKKERIKRLKDLGLWD